MLRDSWVIAGWLQDMVNQYARTLRLPTAFVADFVQVSCPALHPDRSQSCESLTCGISGRRLLTRPFRDARRFPSPGLYPVLTCTRTPRKVGICPSFKGHFLSPRVPIPDVTIRNLFHRCTVVPPSALALDEWLVCRRPNESRGVLLLLLPQEADTLEDDALSFEEFAASVRAKEAMLYSVYDEIDSQQRGRVGRRHLEWYYPLDTALRFTSR
jgi:hypothetical protein